MSEVFHAEARAEHRKFPRKQFKMKVYFKCLQKGEVSLAKDTLAEDLGAGGMALSVDKKMLENQLLMITLLLPKPEFRNNLDDLPILLEKECVSVSILSRVVWCAPRSLNNYIVGIEFLDLSCEHRKILKMFLSDFELDSPDSNLYLT